MATFAKKEKEKKKAKKKQDKAQKREERKTVNNKGKTLDDMIMYIDENGNLSKTPIDMSQRREINPDTIQLGATAMPDPDEEFTGIISFISDKGYGFIVEDGSQANIYLNTQQMLSPLTGKDRVKYNKERTPKGFSALNVQKI
jgi:cold shock CspA family protein